MLLGILQIGRGRHTIAIIQIDKMDTTTIDLMDVMDIVAKENSFSYAEIQSDLQRSIYATQGREIADSIKVE